MLGAWLIGFVLGVLGSMPVAGPTTALVVGLGLEGRVRAAALVGAGSALPEGLWACLALWGFAELVERHAWITPASQAVTVLLLVLVGGMLIARARRPAAVATRAGPTPEGGGVRSLLLGLGLTGLNPTLIVNWAAAVALVYSLGLMEPASHLAAPFGAGVAGGIVAWFALVLGLLHRHGGRISHGARAATMRIMGGLLLALAALAAGRAAWGGG